MLYFYLLAGGGVPALVHLYLVWRHRGTGKLSISETAVVDPQSHTIYFVAHLVCIVLILLFSHQFYVVEHNLLIPHYLNIAFAVFDFLQVVVPSRGKTEELHIKAAYVSWLSYALSGITAFFMLDIVQPYKTIALLCLLPIVVLFVGLHRSRSKKHKLYPFQLTIVPLFVLFLLFVVMGSL